ncbi:MAG: hypothetical protein ACE5I7_16490 [Candidatus Binatia bacterium]
MPLRELEVAGRAERVLVHVLRGKPCVLRESDAVRRKQTFVIGRYALIRTTGALSFIEIAREASPIPVALLVIVALASNVALSQASPFSFFDAWMQAPILVADTALIAFALLLTRASQESFFFFFFVLIMAAKVENLVLLGISAGLIGFASFLLSTPVPGWASPTLMRVPFLFATGLFFGYVVLPERTGEMAQLHRPASRSKPAALKPAGQKSAPPQ